MKARWGNVLKDFTFQVIRLAIQAGTRMVLFENPEDVGALQTGPYRGQRPASMWQDESFLQMVESEMVQTVAFYQQDFGTDDLKPTILLLKGFELHDSFALATRCDSVLVCRESIYALLLLSPSVAP